MSGVFGDDVDGLADRGERELEVGGLLGAELHRDLVLLLILEAAHVRGDRVAADPDVQDAVAAVGAGHRFVARAGVGVQRRDRGAGQDAALRISDGAGNVAGRHRLRAGAAPPRAAQRHNADRKAPYSLGTQSHRVDSPRARLNGCVGNMAQEV